MDIHKTKFYVFGDSICYGQLISPHKTWVNKISTELAKLDRFQKKYILQNPSINGNTTRQALERLTYDVLTHKPDYALIQFGLNDCNYWATDNGQPRVSPEAFEANLEEIISKIISSGTRCCFINTNHPTNKGSLENVKSLVYEESNIKYNEIIRQLSNRLKEKKLPISLLDVEGYFMKIINQKEPKSIKQFLLEDGVHLSEEGHKIYSDFVIPKILKIILNE